MLLAVGENVVTVVTDDIEDEDKVAEDDDVSVSANERIDSVVGVTDADEEKVIWEAEPVDEDVGTFETLDEPVEDALKHMVTDGDLELRTLLDMVCDVVTEAESDGDDEDVSWFVCVKQHTNKEKTKYRRRIEGIIIFIDQSWDRGTCVECVIVLSSST